MNQETLIDFFTTDENSRVDFMKDFAFNLKNKTKLAKASKASYKLIPVLIKQSSFFITMQNRAEEGESSATLLAYTPDSIIVFSGMNEELAEWKIIHDGFYDDSDDIYCEIHNLSDFVNRGEFLLTLRHFFPEPFTPIVWADCIEIKW